MGRFQGPQGKGAKKRLKETKREEADARNNRPLSHPSPVDRMITSEELFLAKIFGTRELYVNLIEGQFGKVDPDTGDIHYLGGTLYEGIDF